ncbi:MAG: hypothetical protein ACXIUZ_00645 [Lysobacteraceae bacterium]
MSVDEVRSLLHGMSEKERSAIFAILREDYKVPLHQLEVVWQIRAEAILEAIHQSPDLTQRGIRGILAEATFRSVVVPQRLGRWTSLDVVGDQSYDLLLDDGSGPIRVQVKNQRKAKGEPMLHDKVTDPDGEPVYVVETQRTRNGKKKDAEGKSKATRPYTFKEFDVLAVCLQPSCGDWEAFAYCATRHLLPRKNEPHLLEKLQPVFLNNHEHWTMDFEKAVRDSRAAMGPPT